MARYKLKGEKCSVLVLGPLRQWYVDPHVRDGEVARAPVHATLEPVLVNFVYKRYHVVLL